MAAILDLLMFYHQTEYANGFPISENIQKHVLYSGLYHVPEKILTLIKFTPAVAAILDFVILRHQ